MSDAAGRGWVVFELHEPLEIDRIVWSRDRQGKFDDRLPTLYGIEVGESLESMRLVCGASTAKLAARQTLQDSRQALAARISKLGQVPTVFAGILTEPEPTHLLARGDAEQPLERVAPGVLSALSDVVLPPDASDLDRRRALAEWIAHPNNPLTARVMVNRIWQWHFGIGLVDTPSDFGRSGSRPTHPELLDWLASEFIDSGWSIKALQRLILLSATYRQSSQIDQRSLAQDSDGRLLWCFPSRRLQAEAIRDTMLFASGRLDRAAGGPGYDLFASRGGLSGFPPIESFTGDGLRRMIYAHKIRMEREAVFGAFDCPDAGQSTARRRQSTTPIQALNLFNSRFTIEESQAFAQRVVDEVGESPCHQIDRVYEIAFGRMPLPVERDEALPLVQTHGLSMLCRVVFNSNEFLFIP